MTRLLSLPDGFPLPGMNPTLDDADTMHAGQDAHYLAVGLSALRAIEAALGGRTPRAILDLPCGFGRVTRMLRARYPRARITACDLDRPGVDFVAAQFAARAAYSVENFAALDLGETYDLIWVGSLVTHLSEAQSRAFLAAMARHATPRTVLVVTSHGPSIALGLQSWGYGLDHLSVRGLLDDYRAHRYGHRGYGGGEGYGISMTDRAWWQRAVAGGKLRLDDYIERGWDDHQDVVVLGRRGQASLAAARLARRLRGPFGTPAWEYPPPPLPEIPEPERFDAGYYLGAYPDVAAAVRAGSFVSGHDHYLRLGRAEGRRPYPDVPPIPAAAP